MAMAIENQRWAGVGALMARKGDSPKMLGFDILTVRIGDEKLANSSVMSTKGQVTVPKNIRTRLGLKVGDRVEFVVKGNHTIIRPVRDSVNPFEKYAGALPAFPGGINEINAWVRSMRDEE